ncbi:MAG: T9SS type A sorting domain-containing protein [Bacteroidota bacterium]|nr:T9SS type A sorting domain-containing protein [Bacteroidota bacterium]
MKKNLFTFGLVVAGMVAVAQSPRLSLFEEFTGENCPPCASTNPGLNATLASPTNTTKVISIKWQVPIPSAPTNTWSLWKTNQSEITWRYSAGGYNYPSAWTSTDTPSNGVNSAPQGRMDGQHLWAIPGGGAANDHAFYCNNTLINAASSFTSPFSITMNRAWDPTFSSVTVTVNIQATANYTATGALVYRLVMIERHIHFPTPSGTNGEKDFEDVAIKAYPTTQAGTVTTSMGTAMASAWTIGQTQTFTINCPLPSYTRDKSEVAFVGFIQDDGNKRVQQAALANVVGVSNDAKADAVGIGAVVCSTTLVPTATIKNNGTNAITAFTVSPTLDAVVGTDVVWTGNLAAGASTTIPLNLITVTAGSHTYSYNITSVSAGDFNTGNNKFFNTTFVCSPTYFAGPVTQPFTVATFPPTNWNMVNANAGPSWSRLGSTGAYGSNTGAAKYDFYNNGATGDADDLYLPPTDLTAVTSPVLSFDVAYAFYTAVPNNENDRLEVKVSTDCGQNWTTVFNQAGTALATSSSPVTSNFVPTAAQWKTVTVAVPTLANSPTALVKFVATTDYGNNMYVDNINLAQANPTSVKTNAINNVSFDVYPNPTKGETTLNISAVTAGNANVVVINTLGQVVYSKQIELTVGINTLQLDANNFANGLYTVSVESTNGSMVKKLTVTK